MLLENYFRKMSKIKEENHKNDNNLQTTKEVTTTSQNSCKNLQIILPDKNHINCDINNQQCCNKCLYNLTNNIDSDSITISSGNLEKLYKIKLKTSLQYIYILLGILFLCIFTLTLFLYTYLSANNNYEYDNLKILLRNNIQNELLLDKHFLDNIVFNIIENNKNNNKFFKNNYQTDKWYFNNYDKLKSTTLPYDGSEIVQNERKRSIPSTTLFSKSFKDNENHELEKYKRKRRDALSQSRQAEPLIEFFNPNYRKDLDEQEAELKRRTGKGSAANGDDWVYLTSYCRVPERTITGFCKGTQDYCPPSPPGPQGPFGPKGPTGPPGLPGVPGQKGNRGDVGLPGPPGIDGREGPFGPRGPKGDPGLPGTIGLDGRDGIPGEPGLDGVPGRAGADGIPGKDGKDGTPGRDGRDGSNGRDGAPGPKGLMGPPGERGLKGIAGPRGRSGKSGINGTPGIPGINAWKVKVNGTYSSELLIPPSIADNNTPNITRSVIVEEGKNLRLVCAANGNPLPHVEWRRTDGRTIPNEREELSSVSGYALIINNITRSHMAAYTCFADNGIPPVANATFLVEVHFSPMISVYRQIIFAIEGASASLECQVEAFPEAIRYWERVSDGKILDPGEKYRIETYPDGFKTTMRLTINNLNFMDFGQYFCVAKNELNSTIASFDVIKKNPSLEIPTMRNEVKIFGNRPPERSCPPAPVCQDCPDASDFQCKDDITLNFDIQPTGNYSYPGLPKRESTCVLYAVGKPVFHKSSTDTFGAWLKDSAAKPADKDKIYVTREGINNRLYEYINKNNYRNNIPFRHYEIKEGFMGNTHVVYNGSLFFHQNNTENVTKFDLKKEKVMTTATLPYLGYSDGNTLYTTEHNYMDFNVDDVGLWIIYSTKQSNNTIVAKLDSETLQIQFSWNITLDHHKFGEMFIICGILYAIDSVSDRITQIQVAVDLYSGKLLKVDLPFSNPFRRTTTVGYNKHLGELYSWDKGNQLTYPIRANESPINDDHVHSNGNGDFSKNMN